VKEMSEEEEERKGFSTVSDLKCTGRALGLHRL